MAEITGASLVEEVKLQIEGRSLWSLLQNPQSDWPNRTLFTHTGRWELGTQPVKYGTCSVRDTRFALIREKDHWELYDLSEDPGQERDVAAQHPDVVVRLSAQYDDWWRTILPCLINKESHKAAPALNPFKELYWRQFGGRPDAPAVPRVGQATRKDDQGGSATTAQPGPQK